MNQQFPSYPNRSQLAALPQTQPAPPPYYPQQSVQTQPQQSSEPTLQDSLTQPAEQSPTQQPAPLVMQPAPQPAPAAMNANYSSVFDGTPLVMATPVLHYHNRTILSQVPCILEWTTANRIRAVDFDPQTNQMIGVVLDIDPQQITKAAVEASFIIIWVNGQRIQFDFAGAHAQLLAGLGAAVSPGIGGVLYGHNVERALDNDYDWWWAAIQAYAPYAKIIDGFERDAMIINNSVNIGLILGLGLPILLVLIAFIAAVIT
jgi:hypothetical protein